MSRFDGYEDDSWWANLNSGRWERNTRVAIAGKRGQRALVEFEAALVALPEKRLLDSVLVSDEGVCAVGAYGLYKAQRAGTTREAWLASLRDERTHEYWRAGGMDTADYGQELGLTYTLAWHLGYLNDEEFGRERWRQQDVTPEQRYWAMRTWVREHCPLLRAFDAAHSDGAVVFVEVA